MGRETGGGRWKKEGEGDGQGSDNPVIRNVFLNDDSNYEYSVLFPSEERLFRRLNFFSAVLFSTNAS